MRKLLLLDADVIIDLHTLGLFGKISKAYDACLTRNVFEEAREARLGIDPGESTSIAYLIQTEEEITFCSCDQAAIRLISYLELEQKSISLEKVLRNTGYHGKKLYPRHLEKTFRESVQEGKTLRIQFKRLV